MLKTLKIAALAATVVLATAGASFAATYAWVDYNSKVRNSHTTQSIGRQLRRRRPEGEGHRLVGQLVQDPDPGQGWLGEGGRARLRQLEPAEQQQQPNASFCVNGPNASFCISGN